MRRKFGKYTINVIFCSLKIVLAPKSLPQSFSGFPKYSVFKVIERSNFIEARAVMVKIRLIMV